MDGYWSTNAPIGVALDILFLISLALFPRFSLLFCNVTGGLLFWIGWLFLPRITIAIFATIFYLSTDTTLVLLSWIFALSGESAEKRYGYKKFTKKKQPKFKEAEYEIIE